MTEEGCSAGAGGVVPFRQFVLKTHSRCNLACTYCYIYTGPDESWRDRPVRASAFTVRRTAERVAEHVRTHGLRRIRADLHGGEPLLSGPGPLVEYARAVRAAVPEYCEVAVTVQTNGTLLTEQVLRRLAEARITVGLSLDGGTAELNQLRVDHAGRPSWPAVRRAAELLARHPAVYGGLLCTIDVRQDPERVYRSLRELGPPGVDFLLPHANWSEPPPGIGPFPRPVARTGRAVPYGEWLSRVFDLWWDEQAAGAPTQVRLFGELVALLLGAESETDTVGLSPSASVVIDTDGAIERIDALKSAYGGAPDLGLNVFRHSLDRAMRHPDSVAARAGGLSVLSGSCRQCPVVRVCGGGNYAHRYHHGAGFRHPSVYCEDLEHLIRHVASRLAGAVEAAPGGGQGQWEAARG